MPHTPYRDRWYRCPACPNSTLRERAGRLVCDACQGMMLTRGDLIRAIGELTGAALELAFFADRPARRACPRCHRPMTACRLQVVFRVANTAATSSSLDRCDHDGVWFDLAELAEVFYLVRQAVRGTIGAEWMPSE